MKDQVAVYPWMPAFVIEQVGEGVKYVHPGNQVILENNIAYPLGSKQRPEQG